MPAARGAMELKLRQVSQALQNARLQLAQFPEWRRQIARRSRCGFLRAIFRAPSAPKWYRLAEMNTGQSPELEAGAPTTLPPDGKIFATTRWSLILRAQEGGDSGAAALESLCRAYWRPLRGYLLRSGYSPADADDHTQEFFARLLRRDSFSKVVPERGRFRNFLLVSMRHFLADERDKAGAARRGGGVPVLSLDLAGEEDFPEFAISDQLTPEQIFERHWAETVLAHAREKLRRECVANQKQEVYTALGPEGNDSEETYEQIGARLGLSEEGVKSAAFRLRRRYRELIRAEVAETVESEAELEEELRHLLRVLEN